MKRARRASTTWRLLPSRTAAAVAVLAVPRGFRAGSVAQRCKLIGPARRQSMQTPAGTARDAPQNILRGARRAHANQLPRAAGCTDQHVQCTSATCSSPSPRTASVRITTMPPARARLLEALLEALRPLGSSQGGARRRPDTPTRRGGLGNPYAGPGAARTQPHAHAPPPHCPPSSQRRRKTKPKRVEKRKQTQSIRAAGRAGRALGRRKRPGVARGSIPGRGRAGCSTEGGRGRGRPTAAALPSAAQRGQGAKERGTKQHPSVAFNSVPRGAPKVPRGAPGARQSRPRPPRGTRRDFVALCVALRRRTLY